MYGAKVPITEEAKKPKAHEGTALSCTYYTMLTCVHAPAGAAGMVLVWFCDQVMMSP